MLAGGGHKGIVFVALRKVLETLIFCLYPQRKRAKDGSFRDYRTRMSVSPGASGTTIRMQNISVS